MKTFVVRILASTLVIAAIAGCTSTSTAGAGGSQSSSPDFPYSNGEAASHNSAL
jgi:hypothetical protein